MVYQQNMVKQQKYKGTNIPSCGGGGRFLIFYPFFQKYPTNFAHVQSKSTPSPLFQYPMILFQWKIEWGKANSF